MKAIRLAVAMLVAASLAGCGAPTPGMSLGSVTASSASADMSKAESIDIENYNDSGALDQIADDELTELDPSPAIDSMDDSFSTQAIGFLSKGSTKIGYVRSTEDGKFFLQAKQGLWKRTDVSYALNPTGDTISLKLAKDLNKKVLLRGKTDGTTMTVKSAWIVPDLAIIADLIRTGYVSGKIYSGKTLVGLGTAAITVKALDTGRIYRATSAKDGSFKLCRLAPGDYTLEASLAGYAKGTLSKVTISKLKHTSANVPLIPTN